MEQVPVLEAMLRIHHMGIGSLWLRAGLGTTSGPSTPGRGKRMTRVCGAEEVVEDDGEHKESKN